MPDFKLTTSLIKQQKHPHLLMCAPDSFAVTYKINTWMRPESWRHNAAQLKRKAGHQWHALCKTFQSLGISISLIDHQPGLPDMVFTANAAVILDKRVLLSHFLHPERQGEEKYFAQYFRRLKRQGLLTEVHKLPEKIFQEGAGDCLWDDHRQIFWAGYGPRSSSTAPAYLQNYFSRQVIGLQLISPRFYHLDLSLSPLAHGEILYYPSAFTKKAQKTILEQIPVDQLIAIDDEDAFHFVCNLVNINNTIVLTRCSARLKDILKERGYSVITVPVDAFLLAGGSVCCLTLRLNWH